MLVVASIGWVCVTLTLWGASVWLIEVDMNDSVGRPARKGGLRSVGGRS